MAEKYYQLSTHNAEGFQRIHDWLVADNTTEAHIPTRAVLCSDHKEHSPTRGVFLLTDEEALELQNHNDVDFIHIDYTSYPEQFKPPPHEVVATPVAFFDRYSSSVKNYRDFENVNSLPANPTTADLNRTGYELLRPSQEAEPWIEAGQNETYVFQSNIRTQGSGKDVDVVVSDDGCWFGHPEFQNNLVSTYNGSVSVPKPNGYVGGNVLPGEGTCDLLDLVLDSPYYLDPDWFNSDPDNLLETRWDGTIVPTEQAAWDWWSNPTKRSVKFLYAGVVPSIATSGYTRARNNGSNTTRSTYGQHGTPCSALTFGRSQGWAYNANKWFVQSLNYYGTDVEPYFDILKIFHKNKPINTKYGTQDPTISSNSWGWRASTKSGSYYTFRGTTTAYSGYTAEPPFIAHMGITGDGGRWSGEMIPNSMTQAGAELIESGVIFCAAAGNSNQKAVKPDHPDFNNYIHNGLNDTLSSTVYYEFSTPVYGTTNRRGFPCQIGKTLQYDYPVIAVGALDDGFTTGKERKVNYSNRGNTVDCYAPADGTLAANHSYASEGRYPARYPGFTYNGGVATDCAFGGTSAACPVATGFLATVLEHNRNWTWNQLKDYMQALNAQPSDNFYYGTETTTATSSNWYDYISLEGGSPQVLYQGTIEQSTFPLVPRAKTLKGQMNLKGGVSLRYK